MPVPDFPIAGQRLALLRVQLYTAMQQLEGGALAEFWELIDELVMCRPVGEAAAARDLPVSHDPVDSSRLVSPPPDSG